VLAGIFAGWQSDQRGRRQSFGHLGHCVLTAHGRRGTAMGAGGAVDEASR